MNFSCSRPWPLIVLSALSFIVQEISSVEAQDRDSKREQIAVMVFSAPGVDDYLRASIESDLRNMVMLANKRDDFNAEVYPVEIFYDGKPSDAKLQKLFAHFNNAQCEFEKGEFNEA
jgi:hypothetical protein